MGIRTVRAYRGAVIAIGIALLGIIAIPADSQSDLDADFAALMQYNFGDEPAPLQRIDERVTQSHGDAAARAELEAAFIAVLKSNETSSAAIDFAAKQLYRVGTDASVPVLANLLVRAETSDLARYALERIPGESAQRALLQALRNTRGEARIGIIQSLGERGEPSALQPVRNLSGNGDPRVMRAAIIALGKIGGHEAADAVLWCSRNVRHDLRGVATEAWLRCADGFLARGDADSALEIYDQLVIEAEPLKIRSAALRGLVIAEGPRGTDVIQEALTGPDDELHGIAAASVRLLPEEASLGPLMELLPSLGPNVQAVLIAAFTDRQAAGALPGIERSLHARDIGVRLAAIRALAKLGDASSVDPLLKAATEGADAEKEAARDSLRLISAPGVDDTVIRGAMSVKNAVRAEAIRMIADRRIAAGVPALLRVAERDVDALRVMAVEAIGDVAAADVLPQILNFIVSDGSEELRRAAGSAIAEIASRSERDAEAVGVLRNALARHDSDPVVSGAIIRALARIETEDSLSAIRSAAKSRRQEVREAAIRAMGQWPTPDPLEDLEKMLRRSGKESDRRVTFEGYIRLLGLLAKDDATAAVDRFKAAASLASGSTEKRMLLSALGELNDPRALEIVAPFLDDPEVAEEAKLARDKIEGK